MGLWLLERALKELHKKIDRMEFAAIIFEARERLGLKQYRAAEYMHLSHNRLKNLESGNFSDIPTFEEIRALSALYDLPYKVMLEKAKEHTMRKKKGKE